MKYNFDKSVARYNTESMKWDHMGKIFPVFANKDLLPLWVADMDFQCAPPIKEAIQKRVDHNVWGYTICGDDYYEVVTQWMSRRHDWHIDKNSIVYSRGIVPALSFFVQTFTNPGDSVIIQRPVYYPFTAVVENNGRHVANNTLVYKDSKYTIDFVDLEKKAQDATTKLMFLCSPHNPVGRVWLPEELEKIGDICINNDVVLVSDEVHGDLVFNGHKHFPITKVSKKFEKNTIICTAASKTFNLAGMHTSNIVIPNKKLRDNYTRTAFDKCFQLDANPIGIEATKAAYLYCEDWLNELLVYVENNMKYVAQFCKENIPGVSLVPPEGTYLAWLDFSALNITKEQLTNLIVDQCQIALDEGYFFGDEGIGFERMNVACPRSTIEECLQRIAGAVKR
ncbi:MalY/PatB family protein [Candidatus Uabimicrobium sp. HlEnr_7]|uniref:MalY/PatB family protein n=1 Tax=Candidatus Uabimicrobium helgolandensis TaxID=3095367 RepID=UPI003555E49B